MLLQEDVDGGRSLGGGVGGGRPFLAMEDGEDSAAGPLQCTYLAESSAETSAEGNQRLATLRKRKQRCRSTVVETKRARREQERVQKCKHVLEILHKPGIRLNPHITIVLYCSLGSN